MLIKKNCFFPITMIGIMVLGIQVQSPCRDRVRIGMEVLLSGHRSLIQGKRIGIVGNHTSLDPQGNSIVSRIQDYATVTALFGPEHGFMGNQSDGKQIDDAFLDGIPLYSLYGNYRIPTSSMLKNVDMLIYDIQDVGVKFYTYISSLFLVMSAAEREGIPILVLDRPNPITATRVEGPVTHPAYTSFVGVAPFPIRYGMTVGEVAQLMNNETYLGFSLHADLRVIPMQHYDRKYWYDETGIPWIPTSPNMPTLDTAILYPGMCLFEGTNISEGRGTDSPFLTIGAPFIKADEWIKSLPDVVTAGVRLQPIEFIPRSIAGKAEHPKYQGKTCHGIQFTITDRQKVKPIDLAVALLCSAQRLYADTLKVSRSIDRLWGDETLRAMIDEQKNYQEIMDTTIKGIEQFQTVRQKYLLYP